MKRNQIDIPEAYKFLKEPARYKVAWGGRGGARSWSFARAALIKGAQNPEFVLCTREFQTSIKDSVYRLLCDQIHDLGLDSFYTVQRDKIIGRNGTEFVFEGLKHNITNIKSKEGLK